MRGSCINVNSKTFWTNCALTTLQTVSVPALLVCLFSKQAGRLTQNYLHAQAWIMYVWNFCICSLLCRLSRTSMQAANYWPSAPSLSWTARSSGIWLHPFCEALGSQGLMGCALCLSPAFVHSIPASHKQFRLTQKVTFLNLICNTAFYLKIKFLSFKYWECDSLRYNLRVCNLMSK